MKTLKIILWISALFIFQNNAMAGSDRPLPIDKIPTSTVNFISQHFPGAKISFAKEETDLLEKSYEIFLADGQKIEFDRNWKWKEIDCKYSVVPSSLIPREILNHLNQYHSAQKVIKMEQNKRGYEVDLDNGLEIKFNKKYQVVEYDD